MLFWALFLPGFSFVPVNANPPPATIAESLQPMQAERNWWLDGPGGRYGLLELTTHSVWSEPVGKIRRTTLLLGPWHRTFDLSAPQTLTVSIVVLFSILFVTGWIRTHRYGR
jgi:hypothetical protein